MWGRAKIGPLVRAEGFAVSDATVGRILASSWRAASSRLCPLCASGPPARRWTAKPRFAQRPPRDLAVS